MLCKPLAAIFKSAFEKGVFPEIWKIAWVTSIFKSDSKNDIGNYRPISVLCNNPLLSLENAPFSKGKSALKASCPPKAQTLIGSSRLKDGWSCN